MRYLLRGFQKTSIFFIPIWSISYIILRPLFFLSSQWISPLKVLCLMCIWNNIYSNFKSNVFRLWSSWDLRLVREIVISGKGCGGIIAITWSCDQHHLYAAAEDFTVIIWEGARKLNNGTPKFVNLSTL